MTLKENIRKRISIKENAEKVLWSTRKLTNGIKKIDKDSMRNLLNHSEYKKKEVRDLELYEGYGNVLVLDNELSVYNTDVDDVVVRKSPVLKEMVKIKNILKILWDSNVILSKGKETVKNVCEICLNSVILTGTVEDLTDIKYEAIVSLESSDYNGILNSIKLFAELLTFQKLNKPYSTKEFLVYGFEKENVTGPFIIYNSIKNEIWFYEEHIENNNNEDIKNLQIVAAGLKRSVCSGRDVFEKLVEIGLKYI